MAPNEHQCSDSLCAYVSTLSFKTNQCYSTFAYTIVVEILSQTEKGVGGEGANVSVTEVRELLRV